MVSDDFKVYPADESEAGSSAGNSITESVDITKALELLRKFSFIGNQLIETYSDENQETGAGFIEGLNSLEEIKNFIQQENISNLTVQDAQGLLNLCIYLEKKLQRRANAVNENSLNL